MEIPYKELIKFLVEDNQKVPPKPKLNQKVKTIITNLKKDNLKSFVNDINFTILRIQKENVKNYVSPTLKTKKSGFLFSNSKIKIVSIILSLLLI